MIKLEKRYLELKQIEFTNMTVEEQQDWLLIDAILIHSDFEGPVEEVDIKALVTWAESLLRVTSYLHSTISEVEDERDEPTQKVDRLRVTMEMVINKMLSVNPKRLRSHGECDWVCENFMDDVIDEMGDIVFDRDLVEEFWKEYSSGFNPRIKDFEDVREGDVAYHADSGESLGVITDTYKFSDIINTRWVRELIDWVHEELVDFEELLEMNFVIVNNIKYISHDIKSKNRRE